jgi:hypothetical protein
VRGVRLHGVTLDLRELGWDSLRLEALLRVMGGQMSGKAPAVMAQGLRDDGWLARAAAAGFSHATVVTPTLTGAGPGAARA